jgi:hypothetical protein
MLFILYLLLPFESPNESLYNFSLFLTRRVSLVKQELLPFRSTWVYPPPPVFRRVRVTRSLVKYFVVSLFVLLYFFFWSLCCLFFSDIRYWLPLWYLQTLLILIFHYLKRLLYIGIAKDHTCVKQRRDKICLKKNSSKQTTNKTFILVSIIAFSLSRCWVACQYFLDNLILEFHFA